MRRHALLSVLLFGSLVVLIATVVAGCGAPATSTGATATASPRDLVALARKVERNEAGQIVALTFLGGGVNDAELEQVAAIHQLDALTLQECPQITDEGLAAMKGAPALKTLKLIRVPIGDAGLAQLSTAASLEELLLGHTEVTGKGLSHLGDVPLARLTIYSNVATAEGLAALRSLTHLQELELNCGQMKVEDLPSLATLLNLESLVLSRTPLGPAGLERIAGLPKLKRLLVDAADVDDNQIPVLNTLASLEELDLYGAQLTDAGLDQLALPKLKKLSLGNCTQITDAGLAKLSGLSSLESLNLSGSGVSGKDLTGLAALPTLRTVMLSGAQFKGDQKSLDALKQLLPDCDVLILGG